MRSEKIAKRGAGVLANSRCPIRVTLIDSPFANVANMARALKRIGAEVELSSDPELIAKGERIVLPGVGSFAAAMQWLDCRGVAAALRQAVAGGASLLGVCVGFQLLFDRGEEMGSTAGLGFLRGRVRRLSTHLPVPQIGWNQVSFKASALFEEAAESFYFVHSYVADDVEPAATIAFAEYGERFPAAVSNGKVHGVQFHPEKSSNAGLQLLENFLERS